MSNLNDDGIDGLKLEGRHQNSACSYNRHAPEVL